MHNSLVQACIVVDLNPTMKKYIGSLNNQFVEVVRDIQNQHQRFGIQIALSGYTGVHDWPQDRYIHLTSDIAYVERMLKSCLVSDGNPDDQCRNVVVGYTSAGHENWTAHRRIIFHMGNAPSYGKNYHEKNVRDMFTNGHPYWTLENEIENIAIKNIDVVILKISKATTVMEKVLEKNYHNRRSHGFYVVDLTGKLNNLDAEVYSAVKHHLLRLLAK